MEAIFLGLVSLLAKLVPEGLKRIGQRARDDRKEHFNSIRDESEVDPENRTSS